MENTTLVISKTSKKHLITASKWAKFLCILGYIAVTFMVLTGCAIAVAGSFINQMFNNFNPNNISINFSYFGIIYLLIALLYFLPIYYLHQFSNKLKKALLNNNDEILEKAFEYLKSHYKFIGIFIIVMLTIYVLILVSIPILDAASTNTLNNAFPI